MEFLHALQGVFSIILMVSIGWFLTSKGWFNPESSRLIARLVNYVSLPAYMLWNLMSTFDKEMFLSMIYGTAVPMISMLACFVIGVAVSKLVKPGSHRIGTFRSAFFCSSAVFVGVPVNLALFGETSIPYVLLYFLVNAFLFWTVGNYCISTDGQEVPPKILSVETAKNIFSPPFLGFTVSSILILLGVHLPDVIINTAKHMGGMTTPLSMIFIGIVMFGVKLKDIELNKDVVAVLLGRFIISPAAVLLVCTFIPIPLLMKKVFVIQSALPAMTQTTILAKVYGADTEYAAVLVAITTIVSMIAIPIYMVLI